METLLRDIRYGMRTLLKSPGFTTLVILSLALGIGVNCAIFSVIDTMMLRRLPVREPQSLFLLQWTMKTMQIDPLIVDLEGDEGQDEHTGGATSYSFSYPAFQRFQKDNTVFSDTFAFAANEQQANVGLGGAGNSAVVQGVSGNLFTGLGVGSVLGRTILPGDDQLSATPVVMVSNAFWKTRMGGDPGIVGKLISMNGSPLTIIGVAPPEFSGVDPAVAPDLWIPLSVYAQQWQKSNEVIDEAATLLTANKTWWLGVVGRLRPGITKTAALTQLNALLGQSIRAHVANLPAGTDMPQLSIMPADKGLNGLREQFSKSLFLLMGMVGLVLLIACANIAGLLMARASSRQREVALCISLGAPRTRVIRQLLTESVMLGVLGGAAALLIAQWAGGLLVSLLAGGRNPVPVALHLDVRVLAFTAAVSILSGIAFGLAPSLAAIRVQPMTTLNQSSGTITAGPKKFRSGKMLVGAQVALSLLLLVCAGVLLHTLQVLQRVNLGFDGRSVVLFSVRPGLNGYDGPKLISYYEELKRNLRTIPGVRSAAFAQRNPIGQGASIMTIEIPGYTPSGKHIDAYEHIVAAGYFDTLKIPVLLGRTLGEQDTPTSHPVVVINRALAKKYFHGDNPVGHEVQFGSHVQPAMMQIVGVVQDVKYDRIRDDAPPTVYIAYTQAKSVSPFMTYQLKISGNKADVVRAIEREALALDSNVPAVNIRTEDEVVSQVLYLERTFAVLSSAFGMLALALACVGIYGTIAYTVAQRTREIGIRMALGAKRTNILKMVLWETLVVVGTGLLAGVPLAGLGMRMLRDQVYGLSAYDPVSSIISILVIGGVTIAAALVPACRASQIDPMMALRYE